MLDGRSGLLRLKGAKCGVTIVLVKSEGQHMVKGSCLMVITENARKNARKSRESAKKRIKEDIILIKTVSLQRENVFNMYKSRAIPTLSGENAEYFREIQAEMEHTNSQTDWQSVGEGVLTMMKKAGNDAWGI